MTFVHYHSLFIFDIFEFIYDYFIEPSRYNLVFTHKALYKCNLIIVRGKMKAGEGGKVESVALGFDPNGGVHGNLIN